MTEKNAVPLFLAMRFERPDTISVQEASYFWEPERSYGVADPAISSKKIVILDYPIFSMKNVYSGL